MHRPAVIVEFSPLELLSLDPLRRRCNASLETRNEWAYALQHAMNAFEPMTPRVSFDA